MKQDGGAAKIECFRCGKKPKRRKNSEAINHRFRTLGFVLEGYDDGTAEWYCRDCFYNKYGIQINAMLAEDEAHEKEEK